MHYTVLNDVAIDDELKDNISSIPPLDLIGYRVIFEKQQATIG